MNLKSTEQARQQHHIPVSRHLSERKRTYEYIEMYLVTEQPRKDKEKSRNSLRTAGVLQTKRIVELRDSGYGFKNKLRQGCD